MDGGFQWVFDDTSPEKWDNLWLFPLFFHCFSLFHCFLPLSISLPLYFFSLFTLFFSEGMCIIIGLYHVCLCMYVVNCALGEWKNGRVFYFVAGFVWLQGKLRSRCIFVVVFILPWELGESLYVVLCSVLFCCVGEWTIEEWVWIWVCISERMGLGGGKGYVG